MRQLPLFVSRALLACLVAGATGAGSRDVLRTQSRFRSSLTATVMIPSAGERGKATVGFAGSGAQALGCRVVSLRWTELSGAKRYAVYASARSSGPWAELPATNICGAIKWSGATAVADIEPTLGAAAVVHRLYYKVVAFAGGEPASQTLDVTDPVAVELP
jgi:hypothetical protein